MDRSVYTNKSFAKLEKLGAESKNKSFYKFEPIAPQKEKNELEKKQFMVEKFKEPL